MAAAGGGAAAPASILTVAYPGRIFLERPVPVTTAAGGLLRDTVSGAIMDLCWWLSLLSKECWCWCKWLRFFVDERFTENSERGVFDVSRRGLSNTSQYHDCQAHRHDDK